MGAFYLEDLDASLRRMSKNVALTYENRSIVGVRPEGHPAPFVIRTKREELEEETRIEVNDVGA